MAGFYALAIASGLGLLVLAYFAVIAKSAATLKLAFFSAVAGGTVLLSLRPRFDKFEAPGPALTKSAQPELFAVIEDIARTTNQTMPAEVYAIHDVNAWVATRGGILGIGGRRVMGLGLPLMHLLTVDQLKAVLAHEFGHYGGGDTKIGRLVYHTRMGLGRTLVAVEGKSIAVLFNLYGAFVMRVTSAVSRQEEFAADRFAARATSPQDLADSLQVIDQRAALFPLFFASNVHPVLEEGYWASIGDGFQAFVASPLFEGAAVRPIGDGAEVPDTTYDSHPSTEARVHALSALPPPAARVADRRLAAALLRGRDELERTLFKPEGPTFDTLKPVTWEDVTPGVLVPRWRRVAREREDILKHVRIEAPPAVTRDILQLGRNFGGLKMRIMDDPDIVNHVLFGIACGVVVRLMDAGWAPIASPNLFCELVRGDERIDPMRRIFEIGHGQSSAEEWAAFCVREQLSGPLAA